MKKKIETDTVVVSAATALPKRKASEPFLIPWEGGEAFKLSKEYLLSYYKLKKKWEESKYWGRFNDFYSTEEYSLSVNMGGVEKFTLFLQLYKQYLSVRCSCGQEVELLCVHAMAGLYDKIPAHDSFYLKPLYNEKLKNLSGPYKSMLQVELKQNYGFLSLNLKSNSTFGRLYNFSLSNDDSGAWIYKPISYSPSIVSSLPSSESVKFLVVANYLCYGMPYMLPFLQKGKHIRSLSKSYLFYEDEEPDILSAKDYFKERICKRMVAIIENRSYTLPGVFDHLVAGEHQPSHQQLGILGEWRMLIEGMEAGDRLTFVSLFHNGYSPRKAKLTSVYNEITASVSLANGQLSVVIAIDDSPSYVRVRFEVCYKGEIVEAPKFVGDSNCFFLQVSPDEVIFVDDLELENILREARKSNYILTVMDADRESFLEKVLIPIARRYRLEVDVKGKKGNSVSQLKKPTRAIDLRVEGDCLLVEASVDYEHFGRQSLVPNTNVLVRMEAASDRYIYGQRYQDVEDEFCAFLRKQHHTWRMQTHGVFFSLPISRIQHTQWLPQFVGKCKEDGIKVHLDKIPIGSSYHPYRLQWEVQRVTFEDNRCSILLAPKFRGKVIPLQEFEEMILDAPKVYPLENNTYGVIQSKDIALFKPLFLSATIEGDCLILNSIQMIALQTLLARIDPTIVQDSIRESRERLANLDEIPRRTLPENIQASLRPYQEDGFNWMAFLQEFQWGGILADDMGLGKTLQVITLLEHFYASHGEAPASLVVMPNSLLFNWQAEYQKFAPGREIIVYHGADRHLIEAFDTNAIVLTTYGTIMSSSDFFETQTFSYLIMDESQNAKNRNSKRFESLSKVKALYRIAMTGTPIENGIKDIYAQMSLVNPGFFGNYRAFNTAYKGINDDESREDTLMSLQKLIQPFILRRTKKQVALDLPEKTETTLFVDMLPAQRKVYDRYRKKYQGEIAENINSEDASKSKFVAMEALNKLRQICNSPALLKEESLSADAVKLDHIDEILSEVVPGHKVLLFSFFTSMLELIGKRIQSKGIGYAYLDGKLTQQRRQEEVERFQNDESCRVFLISLKAGGTGLNLTAADYVYIIDPWWNPAAEAQAIDRCYRIGQDKHVMAYKMVCKDSVEEKILALQEKKKRLADGLILDEANLMKSLSKEDLLKLFN